MKVVNADYGKIDTVPFDIWGRDAVGKSISKEECKNISNTVEHLLTHYGDYNDRIDKLAHEYFYNLGSSGEAGADYIIKRLRK